MSNTQLCAVTKPLVLGEGPHWDAKKQVLYFVDLICSQVHCYNPQTEEHTCCKVGRKTVSLVLPIEDKPNEFVIAYGGNLETMTWDNKSKHVSSRKYLELETADDVRLNDGKTNPDGVIFVGSMANKLEDQTVPPGRGNLFVIDKLEGACKGKPRKLLENVGISNGLCWNENQTKMYWADTLDEIIFQFDYDRTNLTICNQKVLVDYKKMNLKGRPDGMTMDKNGKIFVASVDGGGEIIKIDPENGKLLQRIEIPGVSDVSSVAFGGKNLDELYVTTIRRKDEPESGRLFKITGLGSQGYPGVPVKML